MNAISYVLLSDGSSDRMLMPIIDWLLQYLCQNCAIDSQWADLGRLPNPPKTLTDRIKITLKLYETDILFIHRDAENQAVELRQREIMRALDGQVEPPAVAIIPVRMQEAWLLFDERAIRRASGNPSGRMPLSLPEINTIETITDPKEVLFSLILQASGHSGRRLKKMNARKLAHLVSKYIDNFELLRALSAFQKFERDLTQIIQEHRWNNAEAM
jgi:hypothetical protein